MKFSLKASAPIVVLFGIAVAGRLLANLAQAKGVEANTAVNLGFLSFLIGIIAAIKTRTYIERRPRGSFLGAAKG